VSNGIAHTGKRNGNIHFLKREKRQADQHSEGGGQGFELRRKDVRQKANRVDSPGFNPGSAVTCE
jgi:hypothetical protein